MLAEEGILYDDVCLGTRATTQRSDTCVKRHMLHKVLIILIFSVFFIDIHL